MSTETALPGPRGQAARDLPVARGGRWLCPDVGPSALGERLSASAAPAHSVRGLALETIRF